VDAESLEIGLLEVVMEDGSWRWKIMEEGML
jgi:hypothetical protein